MRNLMPILAKGRCWLNREPCLPRATAPEAFLQSVPRVPDPVTPARWETLPSWAADRLCSFHVIYIPDAIPKSSG